MSDIKISERTFERLQRHAVPLVDTIETVINRALDRLEGDAPEEGAAPANPSTSKLKFDAHGAPDLLHTKIHFATINGEPFKPLYWNSVMVEMIVQASAKIGDAISLEKHVLARCEQGERTAKGFKPVPGTGLSVQGQDSNGAWRTIAHLSQHLGIPVKIDFGWADNRGAAYPGQLAEIEIK